MSHRYEGLVDYISGRYHQVVEIGIGHAPDVAFALLERGVEVFATDIRPFHYSGIYIIRDDITQPDTSRYREADLLYSLRPPPELVPYMVKIARTLSTHLIVKPLDTEHPGGKVIRHGNTTFLLWS
ncbi:MAG: hypothetical protein FJ243_00055 [Nitrospira sp.]|nr:hypothetical protein [Nitrospira sp.]